MGPADDMVQRARTAAFAARMRRHGMLPVTLVLVNVVAYVGFLALAPRSSGGGVAPSALILAGAKETMLIKAGEVWRLLASTFLHADAGHLAVNCIGILVLAQLAENIFGRATAFVTYVATGVAGATASTLLSEQPAVGASGAVFGLLGAVAAFAVGRVRAVPRPFRRILLVTVLAWVAVSLSYGIGSDTVDSAAHAGGILAGVLIGLVAGRNAPILQPFPRPTPRLMLILAAVATGASFAAMTFSVRSLLLRLDLPLPALVDVELPGVLLPWPAPWTRGVADGGLRCRPDPDAFRAALAHGGPVCGRDGYGTVLFAGRAGVLLPGQVFDSSLTVAFGLAHTVDTRTGDVVQRAAMLNRDHALVLFAPAWLSQKYDPLMDAILRGVRFERPGR